MDKAADLHHTEHPEYQPEPPRGQPRIKQFESSFFDTIDTIASRRPGRTARPGVQNRLNSIITFEAGET
jgi:hypothetical protein